VTSSLVWISNPTSQQFYTRRLRRHFKIILFDICDSTEKHIISSLNQSDWQKQDQNHGLVLLKNQWQFWRTKQNIVQALFLQRQFSEKRPKNNSAALNIDWVSLLFLIHYFKVWPKCLFKVVCMKYSYVDLTSFCLLSFLKSLSKIFLETCKMHLLVDLRLFLGSSICTTYIFATC